MAAACILLNPSLSWQLGVGYCGQPLAPDAQRARHRRLLSRLQTTQVEPGKACCCLFQAQGPLHLLE